MEIINYPNYLIFRNGSVLSKGSKFNKPRFLKLVLNSNGYYWVNLRDGRGGGKPQLIHRLLAQAYIPNPENKECIDHIDRCRTNNILLNLRWATRKENNNNMSERSINKNNKTGHKNITQTIDKRGLIGYRFRITRDGKLLCHKRFKTLEEAILYKVEFCKNHDISHI
jgi:hemin uptake protein HemP